MRPRAVSASSAFGNTICETSRFSGVPSLLRRCSNTFFGVLVGDLGPFADLFGVDHDERQFAIFGRAELGLVVVEIGGERFGRGRVDRAGLRRIELDVFDRALLVLETGQRIDQDLRRLEAGRDRARDLAPQPDAPLLGEIALFGEAELPDGGLEARRIERAVQSLEVGIG